METETDERLTAIEMKLAYMEGDIPNRKPPHY